MSATVLNPIEDHRRESGHLGQGMCVPPSSIPVGATHWFTPETGNEIGFGRFVLAGIIGPTVPQGTFMPAFETLVPSEVSHA